MRGPAAKKRGLPGGASVADRRFKRPDVRPGRRRRFGRRAWRMVGLVLVAGVCAGLGVMASASVLNARILAVDDFVVEGNQRISTAEIDAVIGRVRGESLLLVNLQELQTHLLDSPWVSSVTLRRILPSTVAVRIVERTPVAIARLRRQLYLVDGLGTIIDEFGPEYSDFELPIVDGMAAPASADGPAIDPGRAQLVARFLTALAERPDLRLAVSQVDVSREANVAVLLNEDPTLLFLGDEQFVERLRTYLEVRSTLTDQLDDVDYVDLRFGERLVAKGRGTGARR